MKIGIAGHISTESIAHHLDSSGTELPRGYDGAPFMGTLIDALLARGHTISAFTTSPDLPLTDDAVVSVGGPSFRIYYCPVRRHAFRPHGGRWGRAVDFFRMERRALTSAMLQDQPDVIHAHWTYEFSLAALQTPFPHVITCHDAPQVVLRYMLNRYRLVRYFMARKALRHARVLTAVSPYLQLALRNYVSVPIHVIPNPLPDCGLRFPLADRQIDPTAPRLAMVLNGWNRLKNPVPALLAFAMLRAVAPRATMTLFGHDFEPNGKAHRWLQKRGIADGVRPVGALPHKELLAQLSTHHILVHPSLSESFSLAVAEAMMLGIVVIGGNNSGAVPWVLGPGGITTNVRSSESICSSIKTLLSEPSTYVRYSICAKNHANRFFANDKIALEYEKLYHQVTNAPNGSLMPAWT